MAKRKMPIKSKIAKYWLDNVDAHHKILLQESCEPSCWACDYHEHIPACSGLGSPYSRWNKAKFLQRCHIVPRSLGGSDEVNNLVLMCRRCHDASPDCLNPEIFWRWFEKAPSCGRQWIEEIRRGQESLGIKEEDWSKIAQQFSSLEEVKKLVDDAYESVGIHKYQTGTKTSGFKRSSVVMQVLFNALKKVEKKK